MDHLNKNHNDTKILKKENSDFFFLLKYLITTQTFAHPDSSVPVTNADD